jgi:hypothetical protein
MMMKNKKIYLAGEEALTVLKEINLILISLHNIGSYYVNNNQDEYEKETNRFIDEWKVTHRLSKVRCLLSEKFNLTLGDDDMDDIERVSEDLPYWSSPND